MAIDEGNWDGNRHFKKPSSQLFDNNEAHPPFDKQEKVMWLSESNPRKKIKTQYEREQHLVQPARNLTSPSKNNFFTVDTTQHNRPDS